MSTVKKLSIALTPEMANEVQAAVSSGDYASSSEVIREALRDWRRKRALHAQEIEELRKLWREGIDSGPGQYESIADLLKQHKKT